LDVKIAKNGEITHPPGVSDPKPRLTSKDEFMTSLATYKVQTVAMDVISKID
jgi:hypothetical protein